MSYRVISERIVEERRWFGAPLVWVLVQDPFLDGPTDRHWVDQHGTRWSAHIVGFRLTLLVERWKLLRAAEGGDR